MTTYDRARHKAALELLQLIDAVANTPGVYDQTKSALDFINHIIQLASTQESPE